MWGSSLTGMLYKNTRVARHNKTVGYTRDILELTCRDTTDSQGRSRNKLGIYRPDVGQTQVNARRTQVTCKAEHKAGERQTHGWMMRSHPGPIDTTQTHQIHTNMLCRRSIHWPLYVAGRAAVCGRQPSVDARPWPPDPCFSPLRHLLHSSVILFVVNVFSLQPRYSLYCHVCSL